MRSNVPMHPVMAAAAASSLAALLPLGTGCDTRCVGPDCPGEALDTFEPWVQDTGLDAPGASDELEEELPPVRSCVVTRVHRPPSGTGLVQIAGSFNGWEPQDLDGPDESGFHRVALGELDPGLYPYKYVYDGRYEDVPLSSELQFDGGVLNRSLSVGDCRRPLLRVESAEATADGTVDVLVRYALGSAGADLDTITATLGGASVTPEVDRDAQTIRIRETGLSEGKYSVRLTVVDEGGRAGENEVFTPLWVEPEPFEWTDGTMYLVFVDRFRDGDGQASPVPGVAERANYTGGDLLGVQQALEDGWFEALGVKSIWLSPLYDNPDSGFAGVADGQSYAGYHGYWPVRSRAVEPKFGDAGMSPEDRLRAVVKAAHDRGIRIVMDAVYNHVHDEHVWLQQHPEWFGPGCVCGAPGCGWEEKPIECWFTPYMPDLDHQNPEITEQLLQDTLWWMREFDLDGLRVDAVKHMHQNMTVNLRHRLESEIERGGGAKVYTVGETFTGGGGHVALTERIGPNELDAQFDFPIYWTLRNVFAANGAMRLLEDTTRTGIQNWGDAPMSPFAGNHDIPRLATEIAGNDQGPWGDTPDLLAGGDGVDQPDLIGKSWLALSYALLSPGVPLLYYGDEIGLAGSGDPDNRRRMSFPPFLSANRLDMLEKVRKVGTVRTELRALQRGGWTPLWAEQDVVAFARHTEDEAAVVVLSRYGDRTLTIPLQGVIDNGAVLTDRIKTGRAADVSAGSITVSLSGYDVAVLAE